jgi:hypothetical protein
MMAAVRVSRLDSGTKMATTANIAAMKNAMPLATLPQSLNTASRLFQLGSGRVQFLLDRAAVRFQSAAPTFGRRLSTAGESLEILDGL